MVRLGRSALPLFCFVAYAAVPAHAGLAAMVEAHRDASPAVQQLMLAAPDEETAVPPSGKTKAGWYLVAGAPAADGTCPTLLRHAFTPIQGGAPQSLCQYQGKVVLVVNTASQCGYTYQYEGLEALYRKYRDKGLVVVGFPSNDFGGQEPGTNKDIAEFCRTKYGVQFPMYEKVSVTRLDDNPLYADLAAKTGEKPRWNFHKYVIDRNGTRVQSYGSRVEPDSRELVGTIERLLAERPVGGRS